MTTKQEMIAKLNDFEYFNCVRTDLYPGCSYEEGVSAAVSFAKCMIEEL